MWPSLEANDRERKIWIELFKAPFDPFVEIVGDDSRSFLILRSKNLEALGTSAEIYDSAADVVRRLNSAVAATIARSEVSVGGIVRRVDGRLIRDVFMKAESASYSWGLGVLNVTVRDAAGNIIEQPPTASQAQTLFAASERSEAIADALRYSAGDPDWFDLFKAFESLEAGGFIPRGAHGDFTRTANTFRHRPDPKKRRPPSKPMPLHEARSLVRRLVGEAAREVK